MKILGIGVDIIENKRLKKSIKNKSFLSRLFTLIEIKNSSLVKDKSIYFSKRFAAKESFSKALGTGFRKGLNFKDVYLSKERGADCIEIHTGHFSNLIKSKKSFIKEFLKIKKCAILASKIGVEVHAGHGLDFESTKILTKINEIVEFNIGHFIIGESIFYGLPFVIKKFKKIIKN